MLTRVVLHVGPPKTGTKSIQAALHASRDELLRDRVYFPDTQPTSDQGQPSLAWDLLEDIGRPVARLSEAYVSWPATLAKATELGAHTILVSSEDFAIEEFDQTAFTHLRTILGDLPVTIVFGLRDPRRVIPSIWQQAVKWGLGKGDEYLPLEQAAAMIAARPRVRVLPYVDSALSALQPVTVRFFTVPPQRDHEALMRRFGEASLLSDAVVDRLCSAPAGGINEAVSPRETAILLRINQCLLEADPALCRHPGNARPDVMELRRLLIDSISGSRDNQGGSVTLTPEASEAAGQIADRIVRWIDAEKYFVAGDLDDLRSWKQPDGALPAADGAAIDAAALRLLAHSGRLAVIRELSALAYLKEVEKARDWWHAQSDAWQAAAQR